MTRLVLTNGLILAEPGATQDFTPKSILIRDGTIRDIAPAGAVPPDSEGRRRIGMHCGARSRQRSSPQPRALSQGALRPGTPGAVDELREATDTHPPHAAPGLPAHSHRRGSGVAVGNDVHRRRSQRQSDPGARARRGGVPGLSRHRDPGLRRRDPVRQAVLSRASLHRRGVSARPARQALQRTVHACAGDARIRAQACRRPPSVVGKGIGNPGPFGPAALLRRVRDTRETRRRRPRRAGDHARAGNAPPGDHRPALLRHLHVPGICTISDF